MEPEVSVGLMSDGLLEHEIAWPPRRFATAALPCSISTVIMQKPNPEADGRTEA
jgi:hypothetical protein